jgi:hypothetical protein
MLLTIALAAIVWPLHIIKESFHITSGQVAAIWGVTMFVVYVRHRGAKEAFLTLVMLAFIYGIFWTIGRLFFR